MIAVSTRQGMRYFNSPEDAFKQLLHDIDRQTKALEDVRAENAKLSEEIDAWKDASGLECGGDPDGVTPKAAKAHWEKVERENEALLDLAKEHLGTTFDALLKELEKRIDG